MLKELLELKQLAKWPHRNNPEDNWYACPLSEDGCGDDRIPKDTCNCGAS